MEDPASLLTRFRCQLTGTNGSNSTYSISIYARQEYSSLENHQRNLLFRLVAREQYNEPTFPSQPHHGITWMETDLIWSAVNMIANKTSRWDDACAVSRMHDPTIIKDKTRVVLRKEACWMLARGTHASHDWQQAASPTMHVLSYDHNQDGCMQSPTFASFAFVSPISQGHTCARCYLRQRRHP